MHKIYNSREDLLTALGSGLNNPHFLPNYNFVYDELVIEPPAARTLHEIQLFLQQSMQPQVLRPAKIPGVIVLFEGTSVSNKLLIANLLAKQSGLRLTQVDLTQMVSKVNIETQRNLSKVFEPEKNTGSILLFDEAEALFGKRSEVKDAHDRYANAEASYFIQHAATYGGLTIVSAKNRNNLDDAFLRRLHHIVAFPLPK